MAKVDKNSPDLVKLVLDDKSEILAERSVLSNASSVFGAMLSGKIEEFSL